MPAPRKQVRRCIVSAEGGPVSVRLQARNALRAGAEFKLLDGNGALEQWRLAAGESGQADYRLKTPVAHLGKKDLTWEILVCSVLPAVDAGLVEVQVLQDGASCPMTKPAQWQLAEVPQCASNEAVSIRASLVFLLD